MSSGSPLLTETVVVTGASGFIGRALLDVAGQERWRGQYRFVALSSRPPAGHDWIDDRRDSAGAYDVAAQNFRSSGIADVDHVIHLGAFIPKHADEANDVPRNISNLINIPRLLGSLPSPPRKFIFASSIDVYGPADGMLSEDRPCCPTTLYGLSKLFGEKALESLAATPDQSGMRPQILRLGHTYGPGEDEFRKFIPETIRKLQSGQPLVFTASGNERRSFIYVQDCCEMILKALELEADEGPINVASARSYTLEEVADELCSIHRQVAGVNVRPAWGKPAAGGADVIPDVEKMQRLLGEERTALRDGLRHEYEHFASAGRATDH